MALEKSAVETGRNPGSAAPANRIGAAVIPLPNVSWKDWCPGLDNDERTMRQVLATLPAAPPEAIPWIVRLFENPEGFFRFPLGEEVFTCFDQFRGLAGNPFQIVPGVHFGGPNTPNRAGLEIIVLYH